MEQLEVELAGGWERIGAALLNNIFSTIAMIPIIVGFFVGLMNIKDGDFFSVLHLAMRANVYNGTIIRQKIVKFKSHQIRWIGSRFCGDGFIA